MNPRKLTLGQIIAASIVFAAVVLLMMAAGSITSIRATITASDWVAHSEEVMAKLNDIQARIVGLESAERGYVITGQKEFLAPYDQASAALDRNMDDLRQMISDNPQQLEDWKLLKQLLDHRLAIITQIITQRDKGDVQGATNLIASGEPRQVMEDVQTEITRMRSLEDDLLITRRNDDEWQATRSIAMAAGTSLLGFIVLGVAGLTITRQLRGRKQAESALAHSRAELHAIVDNAPMIISMKDLEGRYLLMNQWYKTYFGIDPAKAVGKTIEDFFPRDYSQTNRNHDQIALQENRLLEFEQETAHLDGTVHTYLSMKFPLRDGQGKPYALCTLGTDITERKSMEIALREALNGAQAASRTKSQFLANMSHELRTPLNSIIGYSEILTDNLFGALNDKQKQYIGNILSSGRHLLHLINDLLDLAKIEAGRMQLEPEEVEVARLLQESIALAHGFAERKGVTIEVEPVNQALLAHLDPGKTKQILYNLLSNAVKFTPRGGRIKVNAAPVGHPPCPAYASTTLGQRPSEPLPGEWLRLSVTDTGIGIATNNLELIFNEFEQVDSSYSRQEQGTGLGLSLARRMAEIHGGYVWADSPGRVNQGSTFYILLPLRGRAAEAAKNGSTQKATAIQFALPPPARSREQKTETASPTNGPTASPPSRPLVMVVEDDLQARNLLADTLTTAGYDVTAATTGEEALQLAATLHPAAITLDIQLPDANGMDVLARLKATRATSQIPVIIISITDDRQLGLSLGAVEFFVKPVSADKLLTVLAEAGAAQHREIKRVLVVDDEPGAREPIKLALEPAGYEVQEAGLGEEALRMIARQRPDAAIVDLNMPGMSGFELVNRLRQNPSTRELPIFIYTAKDLTAAELRWLHEHSSGITPKPFKEQLLNELRRVCPNTS